MADGSGLQQLYIRLLKGWNDRDAGAMASCFSDSGTLIGFDGSVVEGRQAVERHLAPIFADHPTPAFVTVVRAARMLGQTGMLRADVGMVPAGETAVKAEANARQVMVAGLVDGAWRVELFQNTPAALHWDEAGRAALTQELNDAYRQRGPFPIES